MNTIIEKASHLQILDMFRGFPSEELTHLASIARYLEFQKGDILFSENEESDSLFLLLEGKVKMVKNDQPVYDIKEGEAAGTFGFFTQEPRLFTAICKTNSCFLVLYSTQFFDLMEQRAQIAQYILKYFLKSAVHI